MTESTLSLRQIASWSLSKLRTGNPRYPIASVPSLQRGLVWKPNQTELLWDSLCRGFPVGAFVLCQKLQKQRRRDESAAYDLLDGQQRAHAVGLGFEDPFMREADDRRPILWLDLAPPLQPGTKTFSFRMTTEAHPWGYQADDAASPMPIWQIRNILKKAGRMDDRDNLVHEPGRAPERPLPQNLWPATAGIPIPFAWLMACEQEEPEAFWNAVREVVQHHAQQLVWAQEAASFLKSHVSAQDDPKLHAIWKGMMRARKARIVWLEVPEDALTLSSAQEDARAASQDGATEVTNVEHLFYRLNAGGTRLEGDELAYSMVKARWPELEDPIKRLAARRLPEARLVTLAARVPLVMMADPADSQHRRKITTAVSVSEFRRLAHDEARKEQSERVLSFFKGGSPNLTTVLERVEEWLELGDDGVGLPPVLRTSIARNSRDVYALLLWLAARSLQESARGDTENSDTSLRKRILGLATALHWFGEDQRRAVDAIISELDGKPLQPAVFQGLLSRTFEVDDRLVVHRLLSVCEFRNSINLPDSNSLDSWDWDCGIVDDTESSLKNKKLFFSRIRSQREFLLFAQRVYMTKSFNYDPARQDTWDQHNRPWDFDHILPSATTYYRQIQFKKVLNEWIKCAANLRACPMEENRSDQHISPAYKLKKPCQKSDAFITDQELIGFNLGSGKDLSCDAVLAFLTAAKSRFARIYQEWHDVLDISFLSKPT